MSLNFLLKTVFCLLAALVLTGCIATREPMVFIEPTWSHQHAVGETPAAVATRETALASVPTR